MEKQKQDKLKLRGKKEKPRGGMRGAICKRVSANAPPAALSFPCLFGCLCWDVCLSATGEARRTCIKTVTYLYGYYLDDSKMEKVKIIVNRMSFRICFFGDVG